MKKIPFYVFWLVLALTLGLGSLVSEFDIAPGLFFPPLLVVGAAASVFAVLSWGYGKLGWPVSWKQAALAFISGGTLSIIVAIVIETTLPYLAYLILSPFWDVAESFADFGWSGPGLIERLFASPLILVILAVTAVEAPIPEEFAKALCLPIFGRGRIQNERQAFAIGLASGAGFAILENLLYEGLYASHNGWSWAGVTLLRSVGAVLHPLGTAIVALGWYRMKDGGFAKLFKAYLLSVGFHTLWNGGFEPLLYLTGLESIQGPGTNLSFYGLTLSVLLVGYLVLLSAGLWWLMRRTVSQIAANSAPDLSPVPVSRRAVAVWAVAAAAIIIPIGASIGPAWESIRGFLEGSIK